nr:serine palmitoyltransferase small subunit B-like [Pogona vitticeps]
MINLQDVTRGYRTTFQKQQPASVTTMKRLKDSVYWLYFQYMMITCCTELEPWEQMTAHVIIATVVSMLVFTAYVFIPTHLGVAFRFFLQLLLK